MELAVVKGVISPIVQLLWTGPAVAVFDTAVVVRAWMAYAKVAQLEAHREHKMECSITDYKCG